MNRSRSGQCWREALDILVGGVDSPVRAFRAAGGHPFFVRRGFGPFLEDVDGNTYIDFVLSWGPLALGHAHPRVVEATRAAIENGLSFGCPCEAETRLARKIREHFPFAERVRFVSSGTEAVMSAIRLARAVTGRNEIVKMDGCYHGHADSLLVSAGSGVATLALQDSPGVPADLARLTHVVPYNDADAVARLLERQGSRVACVIVEPVAGNMGCVPPVPGYLEALRDLATAHGVLLIFDEVMTGFRVALDGASGHYGVTPDLVTLGKVIGGGMPVGAYAGPAALMDHVAPAGPVYQAGTLSGNPVAMAAGLATLTELERGDVFQSAARRLSELLYGLQFRAEAVGIPFSVAASGTMGGFFFHPGPVRNMAEARQADAAAWKIFFNAMLDAGVYFAPSPYEACFISTTHGQAEIERVLHAAEQAFDRVKKSQKSA
ncbi:MAG TPA: glutamate-1-semialdehyde 2,1-aminomutase [Candidatus Hydrogenedentes bacterium]|nr:glutamate-1-semialdehyde 2,1-aminomutase [Candidatus Hydrogenedentota bacterium]HPO29694.1 glutamate-1-semialdehyde 2,1-aminomutase [Candidatus Hydrogenedentota bacterium]